MRVVVIDEALPHPPDSGKRIRTWELLRRLASDFEIVFAFHQEGPIPEESRAAFVRAGIRLEPVARAPLRKSGPRFAWDLARNVAMRVPYMAMAHRTKALRERVAGVIGEGGTRLVHVEWTPLAVNVPAGCPVPLVVSAHNVESEIWERYRENEAPGPRRAYVALQLRKVRALETDTLARASAVLAVSERDAERLRAWTRAPVSIVPNGVDAAFFAPEPDAEPVRESVLFVGALDWRPNQDGLLWFADHVLPRLRAIRPRVEPRVVGRSPPSWLVERLERAGIRVAGSVPDVRPHVARAATCIVPLRIGGGSRLKICEALAMGRPVVSTTVGAEGLDVDGGVSLADDAEAFAAAVARDLEDPAHARERTERGRAAVLARYTWDRIAPLQARAWREAAAS
jgi:glycosyltransferase involved in cell wall biosynthesis